MAPNNYHYTECGLDNIIIESNLIETDDQGEEIVTIPAIGLLHRTIAQGLIDQTGALSGSEIRFLRTEMGKTQAELAQLLHRDTQSVGRWEREENVPDPIHDMIIRQYAAESLGLELSRTLKEQSQRVISVVQKPPIRIEIGEDRQAPYRLIA